MTNNGMTQCDDPMSAPPGPLPPGHLLHAWLFTAGCLALTIGCVVAGCVVRSHLDAGRTFRVYQPVTTELPEDLEVEPGVPPQHLS